MAKYLEIVGEPNPIWYDQETGASFGRQEGEPNYDAFAQWLTETDENGNPNVPDQPAPPPPPPPTRAQRISELAQQAHQTIDTLTQQGVIASPGEQALAAIFLQMVDSLAIVVDETTAWAQTDSPTNA